MLLTAVCQVAFYVQRKGRRVLRHVVSYAPATGFRVAHAVTLTAIARVLLANNQCVLTEKIVGFHGYLRPLPLAAISAMFSLWVPKNRWSGFTQIRLSQMYQSAESSKPTSGPVSGDAASRTSYNSRSNS